MDNKLAFAEDGKVVTRYVRCMSILLISLDSHLSPVAICILAMPRLHC